MKSSKPIDLLLVALLVVLGLLSCFAPYLSGRFALTCFTGLTGFFVPVYAAIVAAIFVAQGRSVWSFALRLVLVNVLFVCVALSRQRLECMGPVLLYDRGRMAHVESVITPRLVDEIRVLAVNRLAESGRGHVRYICNVKDLGLPPTLASLGWGSPAFACLTKGAAESHPTIHLEWGTHVMGHHALVITDEVMPLNGERSKKYGYVDGDMMTREVTCAKTYYPSLNLKTEMEGPKILSVP